MNIEKEWTTQAKCINALFADVTENYKDEPYNSPLPIPTEESKRTKYHWVFLLLVRSVKGSLISEFLSGDGDYTLHEFGMVDYVLRKLGPPCYDFIHYYTANNVRYTETHKFYNTSGGIFVVVLNDEEFMESIEVIYSMDNYIKRITNN